MMRVISTKMIKHENLMCKIFANYGNRHTKHWALLPLLLYALNLTLLSLRAFNICVSSTCSCT